MVVIWLIFSREQILDHSEEVNCIPITRNNRRNSKGQDPTVEQGEDTFRHRDSIKGITSGHHVDLSKQVKR